MDASTPSPLRMTPLLRLRSILAAAACVSASTSDTHTDVDDTALAEGYAASYADTGIPITATDVRIARWLTVYVKGLFGPKFADRWRRVAIALGAQDVWVPRLGKVAVIALPVVVIAWIATSTVHGHTFAAWAKTVSPVAAKAEALQQTADLLAQNAASISAFPAGAYVHAQAAEQVIDHASHLFSQLDAAGDGPASLQSARAEQPDAAKLVAHDTALQMQITQTLHRARSEIDLAVEIQGYAQKWSNLGVPATLPGDLAGDWTTDAALLTTALQTGNVTALVREDHSLSYLVQIGQQELQARNLIATLSTGEARQANVLFAPLPTLLAADDEDAVKALFAHWAALVAGEPLAYTLELTHDGNQAHGVRRVLAHSNDAPDDYLIVHAVDADGAPVTVPVFDTEMRMRIPAQIFGVQVNARYYAAVRKQLGTANGPVVLATKAAGAVFAHFYIPVLPGRITHW